MIRFLSKYRQPLFVSIVLMFLIGVFVQLGGSFFVNNDRSEAVAEVAGKKIPYTRFAMQVNRIVDRMRENGTDVNDQAQKRVKQEVLQEMIVEELLAQKAKELGLTVTDLELASEIQHTPAFQRGGAFDQMAYFQAIRQMFGMSPRQYEDMQRQALLSLKLRQFVYLSAKLTPSEVVAAYQERHKGSMKDFEKDRAEFTNNMQQERALALLNFYLRGLSGKVDVRSFLEEREKGIQQNG